MLGMNQQISQQQQQQTAGVAGTPSGNYANANANNILMGGNGPLVLGMGNMQQLRGNPQQQQQQRQQQQQQPNANTGQNNASNNRTGQAGTATPSSATGGIGRALLRGGSDTIAGLPPRIGLGGGQGGAAGNAPGTTGGGGTGANQGAGNAGSGGGARGGGGANGFMQPGTFYQTGGMSFPPGTGHLFAQPGGAGSAGAVGGGPGTAIGGGGAGNAAGGGMGLPPGTQQQQLQQGGPLFDMSEFPALGGGPATNKGWGAGRQGGQVGGGGQGTQQHQGMGHLAQQQQQQQQQGGTTADFAIQSESDFPSLSAANPVGRGGPPQRGGQHQPQFNTMTSPIPLQRSAARAGQQQQQQQQQRAVAMMHAQQQQQRGGGPSPQQQQQRTGGGGGSGGAGSNSQQQGQGTSGEPESKYELRALRNVIDMTDPDLNMLALGTDLRSLGLNLNSQEVLYATFAYPCHDNPCRRTADYVLPYCYYMQPPALKTSHLCKFKLETLFYIFYNMPKDTLQVYVAKELYSREWYYHKELKLWFTRPTESMLKQLNFESSTGSFVYFDINSWERRLFRDVNIPGGLQFMSLEEFQVS